MKIVISERRTGKTERLIAWLMAAPKDEQRVVVCFSEMEADRLQRMAQERGWPLVPWQFIGPAALRNLHGRPGLVLAVDNLDLLLSYWVGWPVAVVTITGTRADVID